jgi:iron complex outermembrane recepter protein
LIINILKIFFLFLFLSFTVAATAQGCTHIIQGKVSEAENTLPIAYAQVYIKELKKSATTDENGNFSIENICNGTYTLTVSHVECNHETRSIIVTDEGAKVDFALHHGATDLGTVTVSAQAIEAQKTQANASLDANALSKMRGESLGDALKNLAGVTTINTGATVSKPVIQGMYGNRILLFNNGVRQEGQQWGLDHAPEIDVFTADKLTVIKGAGSVEYGADAIGGIVLVEPKALPSKSGFHGDWNNAFFANGRVFVTSFSAENCSFCKNDNKKWAWRLQGSFKKGGNLQTPRYYLANTGNEEQNFSFYTHFKNKKSDNSLFISRFFSKIGIFSGAHIGSLEDLKKAFEASEPLKKANFTYTLARPLQRVTHDLIKYKNIFRFDEHRKIVTQFSAQRNRRGEFDAHRLFGQLPQTLDNPNLDFDLFTANANSVLEHELSETIHGKIGTDYTYQNNQTLKGGLIPNYVSINGGAFLIERWHRYPSPWEIEAGLRYDYRWLNVAVRDQTDEDGNLQQFDFQSFAGQIGAIYRPNETFNLSFNSGTAWRMPSVNELFSYGVHHGTATFERGNVNLQSEKAWNNTVSVRFLSKKYQIQSDVYVNWVRDFIYLKPEGEPVLTIRGAFPAFSYAQANARMAGFDWQQTVFLTKTWTLENKGSILRASNLEQKEWLILMPADRTTNSLNYTVENYKQLKNSYLSFSHTFVAKQNRVPENQDFLPPPAAYHLFGFNLGTTIALEKKQSLQLHFSVSNLFNTAYRDYLNRFRYFADEMGRNVQVSGQWRF